MEHVQPVQLIFLLIPLSGFMTTLNSLQLAGIVFQTNLIDLFFEN